MHDLEALRLALYLFHLPSAVRKARENPLPVGMTPLLEVAAGNSDIAEEVASKLERPVDVLHKASSFFIEQILLAPTADAYRVLGASREISDVELRRNMALILRWAHPDIDRTGERSVYAGRITTSWEALKSQERRAAYDAAHPAVTHRERGGKAGRGSRSRGGGGRSRTGEGVQKPGFLAALLLLLLGRRRQR